MGSGDKHFLSFHHHQQQQQAKTKKDHQQNMMSSSSSSIPKGCMAVMVGHEGGEQKRFVIPVIYIYHPLFMELLKEAEEEYGFDHRGPINIPCDVQQFSNVEGLIKNDDFFYNHQHHHHHHHHHHHIWCFKA